MHKWCCRFRHFVTSLCGGIRVAHNSEHVVEWKFTTGLCSFVNVRSVMADSLLGKDQPMVAFFLNSARFAALARAYNNPEQEQHQKMVWPLYTAITNGINERKRRLLEGATVSSLYELSTINQAEVQKAFLENRMPILD